MVRLNKKSSGFEASEQATKLIYSTIRKYSAIKKSRCFLSSFTVVDAVLIQPR